MSNYPFVLYPPTIKAVETEFPTLPRPQIPAEPVLQLVEKPTAPIISVKPQPPSEFTNSPPHRIPFIFLASGELGAVLISGLISAIADSSAVGLAAFALLTILVSSWGWINYQKYAKHLQEYRQAQIAHQEQVNNYSLLLNSWERQRKIQLQKHDQQLQRWEADTAKERQKHQVKVRQWQQEVEQLEASYQRQWEELRTPDKLARWRQQETKRRIATLRPVPLGDRVTDFAPRGYAEFPDKCRFSSLLNQYFGSDKIHILHRMNGKIPDFAYIDQAKNLFIDIEIDEPYTPRQYPNSNKELILTHCLEQYDYEDRDRLFINSDWFVIHFSERQVICWSESCCKQIAQLIYELTKEESVLQQFVSVPDLEPQPRWTKQEARTMANQRERLRYQTTRFNNNLNGHTKRFAETEQQTSNSSPQTSRFRSRGATRRRSHTRRFSSSLSYTSNTHLRTPLVRCPQCNVQVKLTNLQSHQTNRCPKKSNCNQ